MLVPLTKVRSGDEVVVRSGNMIPLDGTVLELSLIHIYGDSGQSVMEMSHRSKWFDAIIKDTEATLRRVMNIPDNYKVGFFQGGATPVSYTHLDVYKRQRVHLRPQHNSPLMRHLTHSVLLC